VRKFLNCRAFLSFPAALSLCTLAFLGAVQTAGASRFPASEPRPEPEKIQKAKGLAAQGKTDQAVRQLNDQIGSEKDKAKRAVLRMALAMILFEVSRDGEAEEQFLKALEDGTRIPDYAHQHLGLLRRKTGRLKEAKADFDRVLALRPSPETENEAMFQVGEIHLEEKQWSAAVSQFERLRKSMRGHEKYPVVLHHLMRAEMKLGRRASACKWARDLYSKYPTHPLVNDWGAALENNQVDGSRTGCHASVGDLKTRIRRLWLGGAADRAGIELRSMKDDSGEGAYGIDAMLANHLISEGQVAEALKLLLKHYDQQRNRPPYLLLLAKAASRAGDYQSAIASYQRAFELAPKGKEAANSLFQAAFTSYQIQDYDGATRRFEKLQKSFPGSTLARDAGWHLAWMRYLRGDYQGAHDSFKALSKSQQYVTVRRGGKRVRVLSSQSVAQDRLEYWTAMSLVKMNKTTEAIPLLQHLVRDPAIGYYSVLAYYRLRSLPGAPFPPGIESRLGLKNNGTGPLPTEEELRAAAEAIEAEKEEFAQAAAGGDPAEEAVSGEEVASETETVDADEGGERLADAKSPKGLRLAGISTRIERARDLVLVGLEEPARRELREIEKHARTARDRELLMNEYVEVRNFERASYIGDIGFGSQRLRDGLRGEGRKYWEFAYPRAWEPSVMQGARSTKVPEELIWSIMRAESHFRSTAQSPVGALGLMQLMPFTGRRVASLLNINTFETRSLLEPETNIRLGSRYLQRLSENFKSSVPLVAAGYNAGPHRVHAWVHNFGTLNMDEFIEHIPFLETRNYVKRVVRNYQIYSLLYKGGSNSLRWLIQPVGVELKDPVPTSEIW
jgi:soluble lytic murein transglycosylase